MNPMDVPRNVVESVMLASWFVLFVTLAMAYTAHSPKKDWTPRELLLFGFMSAGEWMPERYRIVIWLSFLAFALASICYIPATLLRALFMS